MLKKIVCGSLILYGVVCGLYVAFGHFGESSIGMRLGRVLWPSFVLTLALLVEFLPIILMIRCVHRRKMALAMAVLLDVCVIGGWTFVFVFALFFPLVVFLLNSGIIALPVPG